MPIALLLVSAPTLFAQAAPSRERVTVAIDGDTPRVVRPVALGARRWSVPFPVAPDRTVTLLVDEGPSGEWRGHDAGGMTAALAGADREAFRLETTAPAGTPPRATGFLAIGTRRPGGELVESSRRALTITFEAAPAQPTRPRPSALLADAGLAGEVPAGLDLCPGVGAPEAEVKAGLAAPRPDELTVVYWNLGKGEHKAHGGAVRLPGGGEANVLDANLRAIAARLRPDLLVLAEVTEGGGGRTPTLDPTTQATLAALYPGQLFVPSMAEFPRENNLAIFSRFALVQTAGEDAARRADGGFDLRPWTLPSPPAPSGSQATVRARWLDWTPPGTAEEVAAFRRDWTKKSDWHTRASVRLDLLLAGQPVTVFPLHLCMPWLEVAPTATRAGFLVDGVQEFQLTRRGPLDHQIDRLKTDVAAVGHGRVLLLGDTNVAEHPRANFPPVRVDPAAAGDGAPSRTRSLAFEALAHGLHDAFAGDREAWSWPSPASGDRKVHILARNRIDNALHGGGLATVHRSLFFPRGADHAALAIRVRLHAGSSPPVPVRPPVRTPPLGLDVEAPAIEVAAPARGAFAGPVTTVEVTGRVTDASAIRSFTVDGAATPLAADGAFRRVINVREGLNTIALTATDAQGNTARAYRSVLAGRPLPAGSPVESALDATVGRAAFDVAARAAAAKLAAFDLDGALRRASPLLQRSLGWSSTGIDVRVDGRSASFARDVRVELVPSTQGLRVKVEVPELLVVLGAEVRPKLLGLTGRVTGAITISARRARVEALARVAVESGALVTRLEATRVSFDGLRVDAAIIPKFARPAVSSALEGTIGAMLAKQVAARVPPAVDAALAGATTPRAAVAGRALAVRLLPRAIAWSDHGAALRLAADVELAGSPGPGQPGSLLTGGPPPALAAPAAGPALALVVDDDLLDRAGWAAWRAGALALRIDGQSAPRLGLPAWLGRLDARFVAAFAPEAVAGLDPATPLALELAPHAPPVFVPSRGGELEVGLGDLLVKVASGARPVLEVNVQARVRCAVTLDDQGHLSVLLAGPPSFLVDVGGSLTALHRSGLEGLLEVALPQALEALVRKVADVPLPLPAGLRPANVRVGATPGGALTITGDLR